MQKYFLSIVISLLFCTPIFAMQRMVIVGDSLSSGYGIDISQGWVVLLKKRLEEQGYKYDVINASITGDTTANGLHRLPNLIKKYKPALFIIELGGNDGLRGLSINNTEKNFEQIIKMLQKNKNEVLLLGMQLPPNYGEAYTTQFRQIYPKVAQKYAVPLVPFFLAEVYQHRDLMQADRIHPTAKAQSQLLENVWIYLQPILKAKKS